MNIEIRVLKQIEHANIFASSFKSNNRIVHIDGRRKIMKKIFSLQRDELRTLRG